MKVLNMAIIPLLGILVLFAVTCGKGGDSSSPAPAPAPSTSCSGIAGTWSWHRLQSGTATNWARGTSTVASDCSVTDVSFLDSAGSTTPGSSTPVTWSIDSTGILTRADEATSRGMVMLNDQMIVFTRTAGDGVSVRMVVYLKASTGFAQSDLAGVKSVRLLRTGTSPRWAYGTVTYDSSGNATSTWTDSSGASGPGTPSVQTVASDGSVTDSGNATWAGRLSSGKDFLVATATMPDGSLDLMVGTGATTGFAAADLAGTWRYYRLQVGAGSHWARGRLSVDSAGVVTQLGYGDSAGGSTLGPSFTWAIDSAGVMTRADDATYRGQMLATKNAIIATQSNGAGDSYRLIIARKE